MPGSGKRSVIYRPFVRCDDPKGVVDCGTVRKPKPGSEKVKNNIGGPKNPTNLNTPSSGHKEEREEMGSGRFNLGKLQDRSSFQILEVSRGAERLNQTFDSWSKGLSYDAKTKDVAKDLLRGALDLQESLTMLGELQKASELTSKKKQKSFLERGFEEMGSVPLRDSIDRVGSVQFRDSNNKMGSFRFRESNDKMGFQRSWGSADGRPGDCYDELREAIQNGLARQNLLPRDTAPKEDAYFRSRKLELVSEMATSSSSWSSMACSNDMASTECSTSSMPPTPQENGTRGVNVIARLMGLEDLPSKKSLQTGPQPQFKAAKVQGRKPEFVDQKARDRPEAAQCGVLRHSSLGGLKSESQFRQKFVDEIPPIVIMKPVDLRYAPSLEVPIPEFIGEEEYFAAKQVLRRLKSKTEFPARGALSSDIRHDKMESDAPRKWHSRKESTREPKEVVAISEVVKPKGRGASDKTRAASVVLATVKSEIESGKKFEKIQKATSATRTKVIDEDLRHKLVLNTQDSGMAISARKLESGSIRTKNQLNEPQSCNAECIISKHTAQAPWNDSSTPPKTPMKFSRSDLVNERELKNDGGRVDIPCKIDSVVNTTDTRPTDPIPAEEPTNSFEIQIDEQSIRFEAPITQLTQQDVTIESTEESNDYFSQREVEMSFDTRVHTRALLLNSSSFLDHAKALFDVNLSWPLILEAPDMKKCCTSRLSLDCSNEILDLKNLRESQSPYLALQTRAGNFSRASISLDQLVEEVCDGLEDLRKYYSDLPGEDLSLGSIYAFLERDIMSKGATSGMWDLGWRDKFSVDGVEQVVADTEKWIVSGLVQELLADSLP